MTFVRQACVPSKQTGRKSKRCVPPTAVARVKGEGIQARDESKSIKMQVQGGDYSCTHPKEERREKETHTRNERE